MDYGIVQLLDQIVSLLVQFVDGAFYPGQIGVAYVGAAGDVFLMPEFKILLMLPAYDFQKTIVLIIYLMLMPLLDGRGMQLGYRANIKHG